RGHRQNACAGCAHPRRDASLRLPRDHPAALSPGCRDRRASHFRPRGRVLCDSAHPPRARRLPVRESDLQHDHDRAELAHGLDARHGARADPRRAGPDLQPLPRPRTADPGAAMTGTAEHNAGRWSWRILKALTLLVYGFLFLPIAVVVILSFNAADF